MGWMPGDNGWASCTMAGGPVDGVTYGEVPIGEDGEIPARMFIASEDVEQLFAVYDRQSSSSEGTWLFVFVGEYSGDPSDFPSIPVDMPSGSVVQFPADLAGPALDEEASEDDVEPEVESPREPAQRFVIEQSWWIAAELCRRHPSRRIYEWHPGGGQYDMLRVWGVGGAGPTPDSVFCDLNRNGTIHLPEDARLTWPEVFAADSAHEIVKRIEDASGKQLNRRAPATTATTLTYRVASLLLTTKLNDRANRKVSTWLGQFFGSFVEWTGSGLLIQAAVGSPCGTGGWRTNRSGWLA